MASVSSQKSANADCALRGWLTNLSDEDGNVVHRLHANDDVAHRGLKQASEAVAST